MSGNMRIIYNTKIEKDEYIKNWWNVVNWPDVEKGLKLRNKLNGHHIRRKFSASF